MSKKVVVTVAVLLFRLSTSIAAPNDGSALPFPVTPSASVAQPRLQDSVHKRSVEPNRLAADAPNILIILIDDSGFGVPDTFGGFAHTPTLTKLRDDGMGFCQGHVGTL